MSGVEADDGTTGLLEFYTAALTQKGMLYTSPDDFHPHHRSGHGYVHANVLSARACVWGQSNAIDANENQVPDGSRSPG
ncbi:MAG TPA: hypothetical protein VGL72_29390, partial [Bryobacteraceae bacterium]